MKEIYIYVNEIMFITGVAIVIAFTSAVVSTLKAGVTENFGASSAATNVLATLETFSMLIFPLAAIVAMFLIIVLIWQFKEFTQE